MTGDRTINTGGGNYIENVTGNYIQGNYYANGEPQSLAEAAAEIHELLQQLESTYSNNSVHTTEDDITSHQRVANEAMQRIESNPSWRQRVINAVKEGGLAAFEKAIDNPAGAFVAGAIKGWEEIDIESDLSQ